jgi:hypothetical protein
MNEIFFDGNEKHNSNISSKQGRLFCPLVDFGKKALFSNIIDYFLSKISLLGETEPILDTVPLYTVSEKIV